MKPRHIEFLTLSVCLIALAVGACGNYETPEMGPDLQSVVRADQSTSAPNSAGDFFPLTIGNQWEYSATLTLFPEGAPPIVYRESEEREIAGTMNLFGRDYFVYERTLVPEGDSGFVVLSLYRQDRAGLYSADTSLSMPNPAGATLGTSARGRTSIYERMRDDVYDMSPAEYREAYLRACDRLIGKLKSADLSLGRSAVSPLLGPPGGARSHEITMLKYPLHPGEQWTIRSEPFVVTARVEAQEVLDLAPGRINCFRLRVTNSLMGPGDIIFEWYGRAGLVREFVHATVEVTGPFGNPIGTMVVESDVILESLSLSQGRWQNGGTHRQSQ